MKLSRKLLFFVSLWLMIFNGSCDKVIWEDIELAEIECQNVEAIMTQLNEEMGIVRKVDYGIEIYFIELSDWKESDFRLNLIPCNLQLESLPENTRIKISGLVYVNPDEENRYLHETFFNQTLLQRAQIESE